ncbi:MAG: type II secretion system F family protein [Nostocoides sp.]
MSTTVLAAFAGALFYAAIRLIFRPERATSRPPAIHWVDRSSPGGRGRSAHGAEGVERGGVTAHEVADALVLLALTLRSGRGGVESLEDVGARLPTPAGHQLRVVAAGLRWGLSSDQAWSELPTVWRPAQAAWSAAELAGAAPAELVLRAAAAIRDTEERRVESAIAAASTLLVLPLGLAILPGFIGTTVLPLVLRLVAAYASGT